MRQLPIVSCLVFGDFGIGKKKQKQKQKRELSAKQSSQAEELGPWLSQRGEGRWSRVPRSERRLALQPETPPETQIRGGLVPCPDQWVHQLFLQ